VNLESGSLKSGRLHSLCFQQKSYDAIKPSEEGAVDSEHLQCCSSSYPPPNGSTNRTASKSRNHDISALVGYEGPSYIFFLVFPAKGTRNCFLPMFYITVESSRIYYYPGQRSQFIPVSTGFRTTVPSRSTDPNNLKSRTATVSKGPACPARHSVTSTKRYRYSRVGI
jgi:hypothetical protein